MTNSNWNIREAKGKDLSFIYSTWVNSYRYGSSLGKSCRNSIFFPEYNRIVDAILEKPRTKILVATTPEDPDTILGYLVHDPDVIHYVFVKEVFRKMGIARSLFHQSGRASAAVITHRTFEMDEILKKHPDLIYNPFILFKKGESNGKNPSST